MAELWENYYKRTEALPSPERFKFFIDRLPPKARLLDFGAGSGAFSEAFHQYRNDLIIDALDSEPAAVERLRRRPGVTKVLSSSFQEFAADGRYDGIWALNVLFFVAESDVADVFRRLSASLKPGGLLCGNFLKTNPLQPPFLKEVISLSEDQLREACKDAGFQENRLIQKSDVPFGRDKCLQDVMFFEWEKTVG